MDCSCQSLINPINPIKELQQVGSNVLLTWVPHEKTHAMAPWLSSKMLEATTNVTKSRALKSIVPLITHMHNQTAPARAAPRQPGQLL